MSAHMSKLACFCPVAIKMASAKFAPNAGFRVGFSSFKYDIENIKITNGYWDQTQSFSMTGLKASAVYGEVLAGIKVKIVGNFSLGWNARYHMKFKVSSKSSSSPWFIPGYGATSPFSFSLSAIWRFGQHLISGIALIHEVIIHAHFGIK